MQQIPSLQHVRLVGAELQTGAALNVTLAAGQTVSINSLAHRLGEVRK